MLKVAVAIATEDAMSNAFVVWRGIENSVKKAADFGYDGVELALKSADQVKPETFKALLDEHKIECPCISTGQVYAGLGLYMTAKEEGKRKETVRVFKELVDLASELGTMLNIGRVRGFIEEGESADEAQARFIQTAGEIADYAAPKDVKLILEPVNRYEINFINSVEEGAALMEKLGKKNVALMPDVFHMNIEDRTIGGELERFKEHAAYIHFADSNRLAPGQGHTDFEDIFASFKRMQYDGWVSVEILPKPDPDTAAKQAIEYLRPLKEKYNNG